MPSRSGVDYRRLFDAFILVTALHFLTFYITMYWLLPLQAAYTPNLASYASLLFLPHGVRILSAWLLGWRAIPLLIPSSIVTHWINFGASGFTLLGIMGAMSGVVCAVVTFWALAKVGMDFRLSAERRANWGDMLIAGAIASLINSFGMGFAFGHNTATLAGYFIGDLSGLIACMLVLMLVFRFLRARGRNR